MNQTHNYFFKVTAAVAVFLFVGIFPAQQAHAASGELWASGYNGWATLGLGDHVSRSSPTQVAPGTTWASVEPSMLSTYGIKPDGTLWVWGSNKYSTGGIEYGPLGLGYSSADITSPTQVAPGTTWASVATLTSFNSTVAIKTDGTLWAWGANGGALGLGYDSINVDTPTRIGSASNWRSVSAGYYSFMGIKTDGTLWAWGEGYAPYLGLGPYDRYTPASYFYSPQQVGTATNWRSVQTAYHSTVALKTDGTLWAWGANGFGQLGLGDYVDRSVPTQVGSDTHWASISTKSQFVAAIKTDGTLWTWGTNIYGELGNGTGNTYWGASSPTQVGTDTHWVGAAGSDWPQNSVTATKTDGTMWAWGANSYGQLGLGDTAAHYSPTQVGVGTNWISVWRGYETAMAITGVMTPCAATTNSNCDLPLTASSNSAGGSCSSGYVGACTYSCSNGTWSQTTNSCEASLSVTATASSITLPTTTFTESYSLTNGTSLNTTCRLLDYASTPLTAYSSCTGSISYTPAPTAAGSYSYSVQAYKASTGETKTSAFTLTVNPAPPCTSQTISNCSLTGISSGNSSTGSCSSGYSGACIYSCSNSTWSKTTNSCVKVSFSATPSTIVKGNSTKLTWATDPATACTGTGFSTGNASSNSTGVTVSPSTTSTYQINCGAAMAQTTVTVLVPTVDSFTITPVRVKSGGTVTIKWSTTNVTSCSVTKNGASTPWSGTNTSQTDTVNTKTTYVITCDSLPSKSVMVNVGPGFSEF